MMSLSPAPCRTAPSGGVLACLILAACAGSPPAASPPPGEAAVIEANRRADAYLRSGNPEGAARYYREALRLAQAVEDAEGIAANAVNLSIVYQRLGKRDAARESLEPLLRRSSLSFRSERLAQAALRRSVLDVEDRRFASAAEWANVAASHCGGSDCTLSGAIHNVRGQIALEEGRPEAAVSSARLALAASRSSGDRVEVANALRLLGLGSLRAGDAASASVFLGEALAIDKELGSPRKIYLDLIGLGRASAARGERGPARAFYERALAVSEADRDSQGAMDARSLAEALGDGARALSPNPTGAGSRAGQ
jgi:tetratricopeptide (TPR) repeat protein